MKKIISGVLIAVMMTSVLCACNDGGNQSNSSQSGNNADSSQQTVTTEVATTQPTTEPNYEDTNYVAPIPQKNQTYKFEEILLDDAAMPSGFSMSDGKIEIYNATVQGNYLVLKLHFTTSSEYYYYNVIYDLNGNMIANTSEISVDEGYSKGALINGIYDDYTVINFNSKSALYNLKTKEIKYIDSQYDYPQLDNGVIIVRKDGEEEYSPKYGALDLDFNEIIPVEYDGLSLASPELFMVTKRIKGNAIDYDKEERFGILGINNKNRLKRTLAYHALATVSAITLGILLNWLLDFKITSMPLYFVSLILIANMFIAIIGFLIENFGDVGKFIALILLVLQLAAAGGTFPIETVTKGFRWMNNYLPMKYTIALLRESLVVIEKNLLTKNMIVIIVLLVVFVVINISSDLYKEKKANK